MAHRNYQFTSDLKLFEEGVRDLLSAGTDVDGVIGCTVLISLSAISANYSDVLIFEFGGVRFVEVKNRKLCKVFNVFNPDDLSRFLRRLCLYHFIECRTKNSRAGADIKDLSTRVKHIRQQLLHLHFQLVFNNIP